MFGRQSQSTEPSSATRAHVRPSPISAYSSMGAKPSASRVTASLLPGGAPPDPRAAPRGHSVAGGRLLVDAAPEEAALGELREQLVGLCLLVERLVEQRGRPLVAELA